MLETKPGDSARYAAGKFSVGVVGPAAIAAFVSTYDGWQALPPPPTGRHVYPAPAPVAAPPLERAMPIPQSLAVDVVTFTDAVAVPGAIGGHPFCRTGLCDHLAADSKSAFAGYHASRPRSGRATP